MSSVGRASVDIVGDVSDFARQVEKDLNAALAKIRPDPIEVDPDTMQIRRAGEQAGRDFGDSATRGADDEFRRARESFSRMGGSAGDAAGESAGKSFGRRFRDLVNKGNGKGFAAGLLKKIGGVLKEGFSSVLSGAVQAGGKALGAAGLAVGGTLLAAVAAVVGPGLISTVGAAITAALGVGLGAGLVGLGALFLKEAKPLQDAAKGVAKTFKDIGAQAAKPLLGPLTKALRDTSELLRQLKPEFKSIFKDLAPSIKPLNQAFGEFAGALTRGIKDSMPGITAALKGFSNVLPEIGSRIGDFFRTIFANSGLIDNATEGIFNLMTSALRPLGSLISGLTVIFAAWNNFLKLTSGTLLPIITQAIMNFVDGGTGALGRIKDAWGPLGDAIQNVWDKIKAFAGEDNEGKLQERFLAIVESIKAAWAPLKEFIGVIWAEAMAFVRRVWEEQFMPWWVGTAKPWLIQATEDAFGAAWDAAVRVVGERITGLINRLGAWLSALPSRIGGWLASIPRVFATIFAQAAARAISGAIQVVNGIVSRIGTIAGRVRTGLAGVHGAVTGAFAGAGSWLASAGTNIINGLVGALQRGFERVRSTLGALTAMLPSWKGPASVDKKILYEPGRLAMKGFEQGLLDSRNSIKNTLGSLTGDLGGMAMPSSGRGYGSSTTVSGGLTFNINVTGATGQQAGQQAAEQVLKQLAAAGLVR